LLASLQRELRNQKEVHGQMMSGEIRKDFGDLSLLRQPAR
jgi:hypothetical protein